MKIKHAAIIATAVVFVAGIALIVPLFLRPAESHSKPGIFLGFTVTESQDATEWCRELASVLKNNNLGAGVFIEGRIAEEHPEIISFFDDRVDIGSLTYDNTDLTTITDYTARLQQVKDGKMAVDLAGDMYTRIFRAPFESTDGDIYSLLSRSGILADFSYEGQYNVFENGQFVKYDAATYRASEHAPEFFATIAKPNKTCIVYFDNSSTIQEIEEYVDSLLKNNAEFVNASELTGLNLTIRGEKP